MYEILLNNVKVKTYEYELQAITWCFMNGFIASGGYDFDNNKYYFLNPNIKVRKVRNER